MRIDLDFDAEMKRLNVMSAEERDRALALRRMMQDQRANKTPRLRPTKGYRGAHKLFRGGSQ